jgi:general nucleoside transport system permease protein
MTAFFIIVNANLFESAIRLTAPIALAAMGAAVCERAGIINIAMEGIMIIGAFFAALVAYYSGNPWLGMIAGMLSGALYSSIHAFATVTLHLNHVVSGAVLNIGALGITRFLMVVSFGHPGTTPSVPSSLADYRWSIPLLSEIPFFGEVLFDQTPIAYLSIVVLVALSFFLFRTKTGLHIRSAGEHPLALETLGVSVRRMRYLAVVISGFTSGLAGAFLSIENNASFTEGMSNGRGFIALAANISGGWSPVGSYIAALFFGFADALQVRFQVTDIVSVPAEVFIIFPYVAAIIAVAGFVRHSRPPKALGEDFRIEESH